MEDAAFQRVGQPRRCGDERKDLRVGKECGKTLRDTLAAAARDEPVMNDGNTQENGPLFDRISQRLKGAVLIGDRPEGLKDDLQVVG